MSPETHRNMARFIWDICNLLRGPYKRNEYRKVILPLTVLRRFDCLLAPTRARVLKEYERIKQRPDSVVPHKLADPLLLGAPRQCSVPGGAARAVGSRGEGHAPLR